MSKALHCVGSVFFQDGCKDYKKKDQSRKQEIQNTKQGAVKWHLGQVGHSLHKVAVASIADKIQAKPGLDKWLSS